MMIIHICNTAQVCVGGYRSAVMFVCICVHAYTVETLLLAPGIYKSGIVLPDEH